MITHKADNFVPKPLRRRRTLLPFFCLFFAKCICSCDENGTAFARIDFESDLVPWSRLKRQAGYFTESYIYRGGLYKEAIDEEFEFYHCLEHNGNHCELWTASEESKGEVEQGTCRCRTQDQPDLPYCHSWNCTQVEIAFDVKCGDFGCSDEVQSEKTGCNCTVLSSNGKYCTEWNCTETGSDGNYEEEVYTCLQEDISGNYCFRWTGEVTSATEIESSACQCACRKNEFCEKWICKERGIERCETYGSGWCKPDVALQVGGGFGAGFTLVGLGLARPAAERSEKLAVLFATFSFGCLPWTAGVVIWGGVRTLPLVLAIWISTLIFCVCCIVCSSKCTKADLVGQAQEKSEPTRRPSSSGERAN